jgi:hypothetical protein
MSTFSLQKPPGFRLSAASEYYANFRPGSGMAAAAQEQLTLAFRLDGTFAPVVVALREQHDQLLVQLASIKPS